MTSSGPPIHAIAGMVSKASKVSFLPPQLLHSELMQPPKECQKHSHAQQAEPSRLVPGGRDVEVQMRSLFIPDSVVIAGYYLKMVLAGTKPVIKSFATSTRVLPVVIHSFQPVSKTYLLWNRQA